MMTNTRPPLLYRLVYAITRMLLVVTLILLVDLFLHPFDDGINGRAFWYRWLLGAGLSLLSIAIGWLCLRRAPGNINALLIMLYGIGQISATIRASLDLATGVILFQMINGITWTAFFTILLVFPDGKFVPRWMRFPGGILVLFLVISIFIGPFSFRELTMGTAGIDARLIYNPYYIPALKPLNDLVNFVNSVLLQPIVICFPISLIVRYRRANLEDRGKLRGFMFGILILVVLFISNLILNRVGSPELALLANTATVSMVYIVPPVAIGNAILRHKLYDIDIIIRRTLIYAVLTTILGVVYFGGIILTQQLFKAVTGQSSDLTIVVSTLLIAALFSPLRRRVQDTIDRRLYRRKYNVETTLASFQQNLRDEVDMDTLKANLVSVVNDTMQPTHIAIWVPNRTNSSKTFVP